MRNWNTCFPKDLCDLAESFSSLFINASKVWNIYLSWISSHVNSTFLFEKNVESPSEQQKKSSDTDNDSNDSHKKFFNSWCCSSQFEYSGKKLLGSCLICWLLNAGSIVWFSVVISSPPFSPVLKKKQPHQRSFRTTYFLSINQVFVCHEIV